MRDPARIPDVLETIRRIWEKYPDLRLGQLILNAVLPQRPTWSPLAASKGDDFLMENAFLADQERGLYAIEEDELIRRLALVYRDAWDGGDA